MDLNDFGNLFSCGYQLSIDERASLEVQMVKKTLEEKLHRCAPLLPFRAAAAPRGGAPYARRPNLTFLMPPPHKHTPTKCTST